MKRAQIDRILIIASICGFLLMSCGLALVPFPWAGILPGALFWGGLLMGSVLLVILESRRRAFFEHYRVKLEKMQKPRNGLLSFSSNKEAKIADIAMVISAVAAVLALIITKGSGLICYILIALTVFSFCMHCILNGRIYFHTKNQNKVQQALERKKQNQRAKEREK